MLRLQALWLCLVSAFTLLFCGQSRVVFAVDTDTLGDTVGNKVSNVNIWDMGTRFYDASPQTENDIFAFVEYVQLMQCSGGTYERDLFRDPADRTVLDDYDFTRLVRNCEGILRLGAKPLLKLGSVPMKYSAEPLLGDFGMNVRPPDDYDVYYRYIRALTQSLVDRFGADEVRTWRFGVMTEYENDQWFYAGDRDGKASAEAYCRLYDYTVQALVDVLGDGVFVGAHAMAVTEGLWNEEEFIRHVAVGTNYANGGIGTHIDYLSASFYDSRPGRFTSGKTLEKTVGDLRRTAERYGLTGLQFGVDEGRILSASAGADKADLLSRTVGYTWQAAYDARLWTQTMRSGIDWFSSWGYLSGGLSGYPTVSYHVADCVSRMAGSRMVHTASTTKPLQALFGIETDGAAAFDPDTQTLRVLLYNFRNDLSYGKSADVTVQMHTPQFAGRNVRVTAYRIDDDCNFFDEWQQDRKQYGITDGMFSWSPDDPTLDGGDLPSDERVQTLYRETLRGKYVECARLLPTETAYAADADGSWTLREILQPNTVLFLELTPQT